jgi:hypothetical protein
VKRKSAWSCSVHAFWTLTAEVRDLQQRFAAVEIRFTALEHRLTAMENRLGALENRFAQGRPTGEVFAELGLRHCTGFFFCIFLTRQRLHTTP